MTEANFVQIVPNSNGCVRGHQATHIRKSDHVYLCAVPTCDYSYHGAGSEVRGIPEQVNHRSADTHAANSRPEIELNLAVAKYLYKWAGHFATRGTGYIEHLEDDQKAYDELQSLIAQEADKLANKARIDENRKWVDTYETAKRVSPAHFEWQQGVQSAWQDAITDHTERIAELATDKGEL